MKVKNIAFSGFMASILMAGAAYAADTPTLATDQYVIQGVNYAISQAAAAAASKVGTAVTNITNGTTIAAKATGDADGNEIRATYLKATDAADTYETKGTAAGLVGTLPTGKANVVAYIADESAAAETAIGNLDGRLDTLEAAVADIEPYNDAELAGRVSVNETAINTINTSDVMQSGATADKINAIASNTAAIASNASAIASLDAGKQANLSEAQLAAANSGITLEKVGKYDEYNMTLTELAADITELDRKKQDALPATSGNTGKVLKVGANGLEWATDANSVYDDTALAGAIEGLNTDINAANTGLKARMTAAENSITNKANADDVYAKTDADEKFATKATTLAGYGITDAMTSSAINTAIDTAVAAKDQLSELTDVKITTAANGQVLQYNSTDSKWENASLGTLATKSTVTGAEITDGTIKNAEIATDAAIAQSKIAGLTDALNAKVDKTSLTCDDNKYCLIVGNTAVPYDLAITNENW